MKLGVFDVSMFLLQYFLLSAKLVLTRVKYLGEIGLFQRKERVYLPFVCKSRSASYVVSLSLFFSPSPSHTLTPLQQNPVIAIAIASRMCALLHAP